MPEKNRNILKLYVVGQTLISMKAIQNAQGICQNELDGWQLDIIDVLEKPNLALQDKVMATPALVKPEPPPARRVVGDLSNRELVLLGLGFLAGSR